MATPRSNSVCTLGLQDVGEAYLAEHFILLAPHAGAQHHRDKACTNYQIFWCHGVLPSKTILRGLSCGRATRRLPKLRGRRLPIKRVVAWPLLLQVLKPGDRLPDARLMADWNPPHHEILVFKMLEPFGAAAVKLLVNGLVDKALERR